MQIACPECDKDHEVADAKLPSSKFNAVCRGCAAKFVVEVGVCPACGAKMQKGYPCPCITGDHENEDETGEAGEETAAPSCPAAEKAGVGVALQQQEGRPEFKQLREEHPLHFTGTGRQFFRIWIVNLFLTIVTLGIYAAWAKVRTRQYFYSHTSCAGEPFDYLADPMIILRGNLIVGGGFVVYMLTNAFTPLVSSVIALVFGLFFPLLIYKSLRFYARNSAYRNIRFHFLGSLEESYITYLLLPFLLPFTLGLIFPYWAYRRKKYFFENFAFGNRRNTFTAIPGDFYKIYLKALFFIVLPVLAIVVLLAVIGAMATGMSSSAMEQVPWSMAVMIITAYLGLFVATIFAQQYIYAKVTNYCWHYSSLGGVKFRSSLDAGKLMWIRITNILALIVSAGLLFPWTKVRQSRYILESLTVITYQGLDDFAAGEKDAEGALGEAAMDFFDFEVGL